MKTKLLQVRIEPDKINELRLRAESLGMSVSEYVRYLFEVDTNEPGSVNALRAHSKALGLMIDEIRAEIFERLKEEERQKIE